MGELDPKAYAAARLKMNWGPFPHSGDVQLRAAITTYLAASPAPSLPEDVERVVERFEITHDPDIGMIHRLHPHGYYVRYADYAELERLAAENERLRAPVGGPVPTDECEFRIGQPVLLAEPYAGDDPNLVYFVTGIRWEHRSVPARGWDITIATAEELEKGHGQTDGFAPSDLRAALASLEERG